MKFPDVFLTSTVEIEKTIFTEENFSVLLDVEVPCVIWRMQGVPANSKKYRSSVITTMDSFIYYKAVFPKLQVIIDGTAVGGILPVDLEWAFNWWSAKASDAGNTHFAMVRPQSTFGKVALETYLSFPSPATPEIKVFETLELAKSWIRNSNNSTYSYEKN